MAKLLDADWQAWIQLNIDRGCDKDGIFKILIDEGFEYQQIAQHMDFIPGKNLENIVNPSKQRNRWLLRAGISTHASKSTGITCLSPMRYDWIHPWQNFTHWKNSSMRTNASG